jgi:hypothetical protein
MLLSRNRYDFEGPLNEALTQTEVPQGLFHKATLAF